VHGKPTHGALMVNGSGGSIASPPRSIRCSTSQWMPPVYGAHCHSSLKSKSDISIGILNLKEIVRGRMTKMPSSKPAGVAPARQVFARRRLAVGGVDAAPELFGAPDPTQTRARVPSVCGRRDVSNFFKRMAMPQNLTRRRLCRSEGVGGCPIVTVCQQGLRGSVCE
jgi:hypothetical protein